MSEVSGLILNALEQTVPKKAKLLVGVSGGADSTALLLGLSDIQQRYLLEIQVAHINYGLRKSSDKDQEFVEKLAEKLKVDCHCLQVAEQAENNIENWAREIRYKFFSELIEKHRFDHLVLAHHSGDLVETLLIKLLQNRELNLMRSVDQSRQILRPFLSLSKTDVLEYLNQKDQVYCQDESNQDPKFLRNRIRNNLIPVLSEIAKADASQALYSQAREIDELNRLLDLQVRSKLADLPSLEENTNLDPEIINSIVETHQQSWLSSAKLIDQLFLPVYGFYLGRKIAASIIKVMLKEEKSVNLPQNKTLIWQKDQLLLVNNQLCDKHKKC